MLPLLWPRHRRGSGLFRCSKSCKSLEEEKEEKGVFFPRSSFFALYLNLSSLLGFFSPLRIKNPSSLLTRGGGRHRASSRSLVRDTKIHAGGPLPLSLSLFFKKKSTPGKSQKGIFIPSPHLQAGDRDAVGCDSRESFGRSREFVSLFFIFFSIFFGFSSRFPFTH